MQQIEGEAIYEGVVDTAWIDINEHMNVAYYVLAFDYAIDALWRQLGMDDDYVNEHRQSTFAVESHVEFLKELRAGDPMRITTQVLAFDDKRLHQFLRMYHRDEGYLAATSEWMNLHVDLSVRRVSPWPDEIRDNMASFADRQGSLELPERAGRRMRVKRPIFALYEADE